MMTSACAKNSPKASHPSPTPPPRTRITHQGKGTALHHATHSGHPEVVAILLQEGADPRARDNRGERAGDSFDEEVSINREH